MIDENVIGRLNSDDASRFLDTLEQKVRRTRLFRNSLPEWIIDFGADDAVATMLSTAAPSSNK